MDDNVSYLVVREIEETEYVRLFPSNGTSEQRYEEDTNYEISDNESYSEEDTDSDTDFDVYESHWFPSLTKASYIEYLDDNSFYENMGGFGSANLPLPVPYPRP